MTNESEDFIEGLRFGYCKKSCYYFATTHACQFDKDCEGIKEIMHTAQKVARYLCFHDFEIPSGNFSFEEKLKFIEKTLEETNRKYDQIIKSCGSTPAKGD